MQIKEANHKIMSKIKNWPLYIKSHNEILNFQNWSVNAMILQIFSDFWVCVSLYIYEFKLKKKLKKVKKIKK